MSSYTYEKKFDVVIVGAGVIGCSIAYFLAKKSSGKLKVAVLERSSIGAEASSGSAGMIAAQIEVTRKSPFLDLALESRRMFGPLAAELKSATGVDVGYSESGILELAYGSGHETDLKSRKSWQESAGLECEWLSGDQVLARYPFLHKKPLGGFWVPKDGQVSANRLTAAFAEAAKHRGVQFFEAENFTSASLNPPRVEFVDSPTSRFYGSQFVFAAGPWTGELIRNLVPVEPVRGQILIFQMPERWLASHPWKTPIYFGVTPGPDPVHCYFVPKDDRHLLLGATMERRGFDRAENEAATKKMTDYACSVFPELAEFPYKGSWIGLRPGSPDKLPILGAVNGFQNVFVASGHFRNGILLSPVTGKLMAELLMGEKPSLSLDPFSPSRFA